MTKVCILSDIHGDYGMLNKVPEDTDLIIQLGDFGYTNIHSPFQYHIEHKVYFVSGNHDSIDQLKYMSDNETKIGQFNDKLSYIPRGWVEGIGNKLVGFLGGAETPEPYRPYFVPGYTLFINEGIAMEDFDRLKNNLKAFNGVNKSDRKLDVLIVHTPPTSTIMKMVDTIYETNSSDIVEEAIKELQPAQVFAGHMHMSFEDSIGNTKIRCLDINEMISEEW